MAEGWGDFASKAAQQAVGKGPKCSMKVMFESIGPKAAAQVQAALRDQSLTAAAIWRELVVRLGDSAPAKAVVANHRRGECACDKETHR